MSIQEMFEVLINYADYDYLWNLEDEDIQSLYNELIGEE